MAEKGDSHYAKKHPAGRKPDRRLAELVKARAVEDEIPCAVAFEMARESKTGPAEVGTAMDLLEMRIGKCQLGLFGYGQRKKITVPAESVSPDLADMIQASLVGGRLACKSAWEIAKGLGVTKMAVASACEALKIRISDCQLGAF
jgi:hypothetical protein